MGDAMVSVFSLWLPVLFSAILVFIVSSVIHMVLPYHRSDIAKLPREDEVMEALGKFNILPGDYFMPHGGSEAMKDPAFIEKMKHGPVALIIMQKNGPPDLGRQLVLWFLYCLLVGVFTAYITGLAVGPGGGYLAVFRVASCTAFAGYSLALIQESIWYARKWSTTFKSVFDGMVYALASAGVFGWLWP